MISILIRLVALMLGSLIPLAASQATPVPASPTAFRITHYDLTTEIVPSARSLDTTVRVTIEPLGPELRHIRLYLHREFAVRRAREGDRTLTFAQPADTGDKLMFSPTAAPLDITIGRELDKGKRFTIELDYGGPISTTINQVNLISPSLTELALYAAWFPIEKQNGAFTYQLRLTLPADHSVAVTDGWEVNASVSGAKVTRVFRRDEPGFDIPIVTGPGLKLRERRQGEVTARAVFQALDEAAALASMDGPMRCAEEMSRLLGPPAVSGTLTIVFSPRGGWGYSRVPLIVGPEVNAGERLKSPDGRIENFKGLAHEAAHFWWNLAGSETSDDWLNEALAEYSALRVLEGVVDRPSIASAWREQHRAANTIPPDKTILGTLRNDPAAYALYYRKGASIFRTLETWIGRAELDRILARFYLEHRGRRNATTDSFLAIMRQETDSRFDAFFDRMLRQGGLPGVRLEWTAGSRQASGTVTLDDASLVGFPLTIRFEGKAEAERLQQTVTLAAGETSWRFSLPFDLADAVMDPESRLLRADPGVRFYTSLVPLLHGPNMDALPELVPKANIEKARAILDEWGKAEKTSAALEFERGWIALLEGRSSEAADHYRAVLPKLDELPNSRILIPATFSALGRSLDLQGERAGALDYYREGLRRAVESGLDPLRQMMLFQNFLEVPYPRGRSIHFAVRIGQMSVLNELASDSPAVVNSKDPYLGLTPIIWSVTASIRRPVVEWLVDHGADVNVRDEKGRTLLEIVRSKGESELAEYLVSRGAK